MKWVLLHKLILLSLASTALDGWSTYRVQARDRYLPRAGQIFVGTNGLAYISPGRVRDITMGYPGNLQIALEVPAGEIATLALHHKLPRASKDALAVETAIHFVGLGLNEWTLSGEKRYPRPACLLGQPGCAAAIPNLISH